MTFTGNIVNIISMISSDLMAALHQVSGNASALHFSLIRSILLVAWVYYCMHCIQRIEYGPLVTDRFKPVANTFGLIIAPFILFVLFVRDIVKRLQAGEIDYSDIPKLIFNRKILKPVLVFGILQAITVNFITTDCEITFPKLFDSIGVATLGFIGGWFVSSFVLLMICIMPFSNKPFMNTLTGENTASKLAVTPVVALCDFITACSIQAPEGKPRYVINELINPKSTDENETEKTSETIEEKKKKTDDTYIQPELNTLE